MNPLNLKIVASSIPVVLEDEDGKTRSLELREMNAAVRDTYMDRLSSRLRFDAEGRPAGMKKFDRMQADLLSLCLYNGEGKTVSVEEIQKWPASAVTELFKAAQELNHLGKVEDIPKND